MRASGGLPANDRAAQHGKSGIPAGRPSAGRTGTDLVRSTLIPHEDTLIFKKYVDYPYRCVAAEAAVGALVSKTSTRFLRKRFPASLAELGALTQGVHGGPETLLATASWLNFTPETLANLMIEHQQLRAELTERCETRRLPFPASWAIETGTSFLLYSLVRDLRPTVAIEMGVGNGHSSFYILRALQANGEGKLHSFDVRPEAGALLAEQERHSWEFRLIDRRHSATSLVTQLADLPSAELCFHDADHHYLAQHFEFDCLWAQLKSSGTMILDDVDASYALIDFCHQSRKRPEILIDGRKAVAVLSRSPDRALEGSHPDARVQPSRVV